MRSPVLDGVTENGVTNKRNDPWQNSQLLLVSTLFNIYSILENYMNEHYS